MTDLVSSNLIKLSLVTSQYMTQFAVAATNHSALSSDKTRSDGIR